MKTVRCPACGGKTKRNGKTKAGSQRWRCVECGASTAQKYNRDAKMLEWFLSWLLSKRSQQEMGCSARTFRRKTSGFWRLWPVAPVCDEVHHVVFVDGIWLRRSCVVLIACTDEHVVGWHLARSERSEAWAALMARIAPPDVVVSDGGSGFEKARRAVWPRTRVQRCTFHAFQQVRRYTTTRPKTQAGVSLYAIARELPRIGSRDEAAAWLASFSNWCSKYDAFLKERTFSDGSWRYRHERLRKARRGLERLCREGTLFTFLEDELVAGGPVPSTNNRIEGGVNRQIRIVLDGHRGMRLDHMVKAVFWWCYMHLEEPATPDAILEEMPTDDDVDVLRELCSGNPVPSMGPVEWGNGLTWSELHHGTAYPYSAE